jgi:hypothetical protein
VLTAPNPSPLLSTTTDDHHYLQQPACQQAPAPYAICPHTHYNPQPLPVPPPSLEHLPQLTPPEFVVTGRRDLTIAQLHQLARVARGICKRYWNVTLDDIMDLALWEESEFDAHEVMDQGTFAQHERRMRTTWELIARDYHE